MCDRLNSILKTITPTKGGRMDMQTKEVFEALAIDMGELSKKQEETNEKINRLLDNEVEQKKINTLLLEKLDKIENKLNVDKLEEKAFVYDRFNQTFKNKWVWITIIALFLLGGVGISYFIEKSSNIAEITKSIKS